MVLLFAEQLRDEPATRVWARGLIDLAITVPARQPMPGDRGHAG